MYACVYTHMYDALARSCALATVAARNFGSIIERSGDRKIPALFRTRSPRWGEPNHHWPGRLVILARRWFERGWNGLRSPSRSRSLSPLHSAPSPGICLGYRY